MKCYKCDTLKFTSIEGYAPFNKRSQRHFYFKLPPPPLQHFPSRYSVRFDSSPPPPLEKQHSKKISSNALHCNRVEMIFIERVKMLCL